MIQPREVRRGDAPRRAPMPVRQRRYAKKIEEERQRQHAALRSVYHRATMLRISTTDVAAICAQQQAPLCRRRTAFHRHLLAVHACLAFFFFFFFFFFHVSVANISSSWLLPPIYFLSPRRSAA